MTDGVKVSDVIAAVLSPLLTLSLAQLDHLVAIFGGVLGSAYLVWRWRRDARRADSNPPWRRRR